MRITNMHEHAHGNENKPCCSDNKKVCSCGSDKKEHWWNNKLFILILVYVAIFVLGSASFKFAPLRNALAAYIGTMAIPIFIGLLLGGIIDWLVPAEYISKLMSQRKKRAILFSVFGGFIFSACSHGMLALAIQLYKKGASPPAVVAFLLASPWANLPLTIIMFGFFGVKALFIVLAAVIIALITGYVFMFLEGKNLIEHNPNTVKVAEDFSIVKDAGYRMGKIRFTLSSVWGGLGAIVQGSLSLANMVLWWIMLGALLASITAAYMPTGFMYQYMGPTLLGLLVTLVLATVIEVCSEGSAPLAFEIYRQTGALGNSFVFLMAGVVTDYTEIGLLWTNVGWKTAIWLPIITVPQVILLGVIANILF
ncbi:MAG: permease [Candidatus Margulisiibacteriota bacterium]